MSNHTKGPWEYRNGTIIDGNGETLLVNGVALPCGFVTQKLRDEIISNANLIAAAPELLEALELIINSGEIAYCYSSPLVILAKKAIAKANGEAND